MAHRTFRDDMGREWDVWEVVPTAVERRIAAPRPRPAAAERRRVQETRVVVPESLQKGWLAFQSGNERRRLSPIPPDWENLTAGELLDLLHQAAGRSSRARRLIE
jgi:hypothetical protein